MRLRRKPWARPELESCPFYIDSPEKLRDHGGILLQTKRPSIWNLDAEREFLSLILPFVTPV
jgi:hypothetical protein